MRKGGGRGEFCLLLSYAGLRKDANSTMFLDQEKEAKTYNWRRHPTQKGGREKKKVGGPTKLCRDLISRISPIKKRRRIKDCTFGALPAGEGGREKGDTLTTNQKTAQKFFLRKRIRR